MQQCVHSHRGLSLIGTNVDFFFHYHESHLKVCFKVQFYYFFSFRFALHSPVGFSGLYFMELSMRNLTPCCWLLACCCGFVLESSSRCRLAYALGFAFSCSFLSSRPTVPTGEDQSYGYRTKISPLFHSLFFSESESGSDFAWQTARHYHYHSDAQKGKAKSWKVLGWWRGGVDWG